MAKVGTPFEKGQSGNPKGRPKGKRTMKWLMKKAMQQPCTESALEFLQELGIEEHLSMKEVAALLMVKRAQDPDEDPNVSMKAFDTYLKVCEPPTTKVEQTHKGEIKTGFDPSKLTTEELRTLIALQEKASPDKVGEDV